MAYVIVYHTHLQAFVHFLPYGRYSLVPCNRHDYYSECLGTCLHDKIVVLFIPVTQLFIGVLKITDRWCRWASQWDWAQVFHFVSTYLEKNKSASMKTIVHCVAVCLCTFIHGHVSTGERSQMQVWLWQRFCFSLHRELWINNKRTCCTVTAWRWMHPLHPMPHKIFPGSGNTVLSKARLSRFWFWIIDEATYMTKVNYHEQRTLMIKYTHCDVSQLVMLQQCLYISKVMADPLWDG